MTVEKIRRSRCEVEIVEHCNLVCRSCSHLSPVLPKREVAADVVHRDLARLWEHYETNWVALLGGEPLLHRDLVSVIDAVHAAAAPPAKAAVVTNGTLLPRMTEEFWRAIDGVQVCFYAGNELGEEELQVCRGRARAHGVPIVVTPVTRFRESYTELGTADEGLVREIYSACTLRQSHAIADGRFYKCPPSYFLPKIVDGLDPEAGVALDGEPDLGERLRAYLGEGEPLGACRNCLGSSGKRFPQGQTGRSEFRSHQRRTTEELVDRRELRPPSRMRNRLRRVSPAYLRERRLL